MSLELLYTSAESGLRQGSRGFCTVLSTSGLPVNLATKLETLSGYRHVYSPQHESADQNPVCHSHVRLRVGGRVVSVLSRVSAYGVDYSGRTNKLAHHVAIEPHEQPPAGPAWLLRQPGMMRQSWDGQVASPPTGPAIPAGDQSASVCQRWKSLTGDAGWGGALAQAWANPASKPQWIVFSLDQRAELLALIDESIALLPENQRWNATFSTYYTNLPPEADCRVRCVLAGTEEARLAAARGRVIDLTQPGAVPTDTPLVETARSGGRVEPVAAETTTASAPAALPDYEDADALPVSHEHEMRLEFEPASQPPSLSQRASPPGVPRTARSRRLPSSKAVTAAAATGLLLISAGFGAAWLFMEKSTNVAASAAHDSTEAAAGGNAANAADETEAVPEQLRKELAALKARLDKIGKNQRDLGDAEPPPKLDFSSSEMDLSELETKLQSLVKHEIPDITFAGSPPAGRDAAERRLTQLKNEKAKLDAIRSKFNKFPSSIEEILARLTNSLGEDGEKGKLAEELEYYGEEVNAFRKTISKLEIWKKGELEEVEEIWSEQGRLLADLPAKTLPQSSIITLAEKKEAAEEIGRVAAAISDLNEKLSNCEDYLSKNQEDLGDWDERFHRALVKLEWALDEKDRLHEYAETLDDNLEVAEARLARLERQRTIELRVKYNRSGKLEISGNTVLVTKDISGVDAYRWGGEERDAASIAVAKSASTASPHRVPGSPHVRMAAWTNIAPDAVDSNSGRIGFAYTLVSSSESQKSTGSSFDKRCHDFLKAIERNAAEKERLVTQSRDGAEVALRDDWEDDDDLGMNEIKKLREVLPDERSECSEEYSSLIKDVGRVGDDLQRVRRRGVSASKMLGTLDGAISDVTDAIGKADEISSGEYAEFFDFSPNPDALVNKLKPFRSSLEDTRRWLNELSEGTEVDLGTLNLIGSETGANSSIPTRKVVAPVDVELVLRIVSFEGGAE